MRAGKKGLRGSFKVCVRDGGGFSLSQWIGFSVTSRFAQKRLPGQKAAGSAAARVQGRSRRLPALGGRGTGLGLTRPPGAGAAKGGHTRAGKSPGRKADLFLLLSPGLLLEPWAPDSA